MTDTVELEVKSLPSNLVVRSEVVELVVEEVQDE